MFTTGGRGGEVYEVTTLADSGPGSLRDAVSSPNRTIVFRISGTIELEDNLLLNAPNITIAGQTAPGSGICLKNYALRVNARNIIIRYLRIRPGDQGRDAEVDGISMGPRGGSDLVFDHCSVSWAIDENFSVYGLPRTTVQWCIISEALTKSKHRKGAHGMGGILNGYDMTLHHNLFASNNDRNPKFDVADWWPGKNTDFRNNVVYNWGARATWGGNGGNTITNVMGNYYKAGPDSRHPRAFLTLAGGTPGEWFVEGNVLEGAEDISRDNWSGVVNTNGNPIPNAVRCQRPASSAPIAMQSAAMAYRMVLQSAGAIFPVRDSVDRRIVGEVVSGAGRLIDSPADVGGWPELSSRPAPVDTDHDGMPDAWELAHGLNPNDPSDRNRPGEDGYTKLEIYLNGLVSTVPAPKLSDRPAEAFWPNPRDGAVQTDNAPVLRWKTGFGTTRERIYFGLKPNLGPSDWKAEQQQSCAYVEKQEISSSRFSPGLLRTATTYYWRIDEINDSGVTTGVTWSFTPGAPEKGPRGHRMEAEDMTLESAAVEKHAPASGGKYASVPAGTGVMRFEFAGEPGTYGLVVRYLDEGDGAGEISVHRNGALLGTWTANANNDLWLDHRIAGVRLAPGDVIKITSHRQRDELGRIDYLDLEPAPPARQNQAPHGDG